MAGKQMELTETIKMMESTDYKERFKAEYHQLAIRIERLKAMVDKWEAGMLAFKPTCPLTTYVLQLNAMCEYFAILEARAVMEGIDLEC